MTGQRDRWQQAEAANQQIADQSERAEQLTLAAIPGAPSFPAA
jgi:hypothetical protein